jgi:hypothetical protein
MTYHLILIGVSEKGHFPSLVLVLRFKNRGKMGRQRINGLHRIAHTPPAIENDGDIGFRNIEDNEPYLLIATNKILHLIFLSLIEL